MKTINEIAKWYAVNHLETQDTNSNEENQAQLMVLNIIKAYQLTGATSSELVKCLLSLLDAYNNLNLEDYSITCDVYIVKCMIQLHQVIDMCLQ